MGDEKKKSKGYDIAYYTLMTAAIIAFAFFGYMKLADVEIVLFNRIIGCYTICFTVVLVFLIIRIFALYDKIKKIDYQMGLMISAGIIALLCFINSIAEDFGKSKTKDIITVNETTDVYLCECMEDNGHTKIDVYRVRDRLAKKIGEIDERPFAYRCVADDSYSYSIGENGDIIDITCNYGQYIDERTVLKSGYDSGYLTYSFALD